MDVAIKEEWLKKEFKRSLFSSEGVKVAEIKLKLEVIEQNDCRLRVEAEKSCFQYFQGFNCAQCLDKYRQSLDELSFVIGCYGAVRNFYVTKGMAGLSFGLVGLLTEFGKTPVTGADLPKVSTFMRLEEPNQLSSFKDQRAFRSSSNSNRVQNLA